jgi:hypothetical protein
MKISSQNVRNAIYFNQTRLKTVMVFNRYIEFVAITNYICRLLISQMVGLLHKPSRLVESLVDMTSLSIIYPSLIFSSGLNLVKKSMLIRI